MFRKKKKEIDLKTLSELEYKPEMINIADLEISRYNTRYNRIDLDLVEQLKQSITARGYDENFPLSVGTFNLSDKMEVLGGAHRFEACKALSIKCVPANVYRGITAEEGIAISFNNNQNQQTFKPETFLDLAYVVYRLIKDDGKTLERIGASFDNMSKSTAGRYFDIYDKLSNEVLSIVEGTFFSPQLLQNGEGNKMTHGEMISPRGEMINWQFSWFRDITPLSHKYQHQIVDKIIGNKDKATTKQIQDWSDNFKCRQALQNYLEANVPDEYLAKQITILDEGTYDGYVEFDKETKQYVISDTIISIIEQLKQQSVNRLENADCLDIIPTLQDKSIDCLLTDPPYGIEYKSNRRQDKTDEINVPIRGDDDAVSLLFDCLELLSPKMKDDSHCYIFCDWGKYPDIKIVVEKHFAIKNLLIWNKDNHGAGDLKGSYAPKYECIIFGVKGKKNLVGEKRLADVLNFPKVSSNERKHPAEKPVVLLSTLLSQSCGQGEIIIDPFAGVGSSLIAAKSQDIGYIGCEIEKKFYDIALLKLRELSHAKNI